MFKNPVPVAVVLVPVGSSLLGIKRNIEPGKGKVALPGGYIDSTETWQDACSRECLEETGIEVLASEISLFSVESALDSDRLLVFGLAPTVAKDKIDFALKNDETMEVVLIGRGMELAFPLHTKIAEEYFQKMDGSLDLNLT